MLNIVLLIKFYDLVLPKIIYRPGPITNDSILRSFVLDFKRLFGAFECGFGSERPKMRSKSPNLGSETPH